MENSHDFFLINPIKSTSFLTDSGSSAYFFQYPLKFHVLNSPYLTFSWNRVVIEMCFVSIILKRIRGGRIRKYQFLFFMLRQLKRSDTLRNSEKVAWNSAILEANPFRGSQNSFYKTFLKNFLKFTEKDLCRVSFLKYSATLKEGSGTSVFLWVLKFFKTHFFAKCLQVTASAPWKITQKSLRNHYKTYH